MSGSAIKYVKRLVVRPGGSRHGKPLSGSEKLLLRELALHYDDTLGCAWGSVATYAHACGWSSRRVQVLLAELEECGLLLRTAMKRAADKSQTTNLYEFPLMGYAAGFDVNRLMCKAAEWPMCKAAANHEACKRAEFFRDGRTPLSNAAVQMSLKVHPPGEDSVHPPGEDSVHPSEYEGEYERDFPQLKQVPAAVESAKPLSEASVRACLDMANASEATASATANAKTERGERASRERGAGGDSGMSSGGRGLDGEDAAWEAEVTRVLFAIGVVDGAIRRHLRRALQDYSARSGCTIAAAGMLAEQRWNEFNDAGVVRAFYLRPRTFFGEGLWLRPQAWSLNTAWLRDRRDINPNIGRWRN